MIRNPMSSASFHIDLHVHSLLSEDNSADPEKCILRAIELGLHGLAFTEHYWYGISEPHEKLIKRYRDRILILRGVEFSAAEGHCLVFGANTDHLPRKYGDYPQVEDVVREVNRAGGVVIPSHPYRSGSGVGDLIRCLPGIAAVEGYNGNNLHADNLRAIDAARSLHLPCIGGSDAHRPEDVGLCYTVFPERVTAENLVPLLRAGRYGADESEKRKKMSRGLRSAGTKP